MGRYSRRPAAALNRISSPLARVLNAVSARWGPLILEALAVRPVRFNELHRSLAGISHKVLIETLRMLERDGFVSRQAVCDHATHQSVTEYRLTEAGTELVSWLHQIRQWAEQREHRSASRWGG
jgi:DNA-binding HxlR family transcriptional regulator